MQSSGHISGARTHRSIPMWSILVHPEGARKWLEMLEGRKMDGKWQHFKHKYWTDGRGKRWSSTVPSCNITQVDLFYVNSCIDYFQGFKSLQQKGGPLKEYVNICQAWKIFPSSIRQGCIFEGSLTWSGSAIWAGRHEALWASPRGAHNRAQMVVILSSLGASRNSFSFSFELGNWKITEYENTTLLLLIAREPCI